LTDITGLHLAENTLERKLSSIRSSPWVRNVGYSTAVLKILIYEPVSTKDIHKHYCSRSCNVQRTDWRILTTRRKNNDAISLRSCPIPNGKQSSYILKELKTKHTSVTYISLTEAVQCLRQCISRYVKRAVRHCVVVRFSCLHEKAAKCRTRIR